MAISKEQVLEIQNLSRPGELAANVATLWSQWKGARSTWEEEKEELRNYVFATDTRKTTNGKLPWKNSTTIPKLTQIRDNLHANYYMALFPHRDWFKWSPESRDDATKQKARSIEAYMKTKLETSGFYAVVSRLLYDYIDYGNAFGDVGYAYSIQNTEGGDPTQVYQGPALNRVSPMDIVFDLTASTFQTTPKITRSLVSLGTLKKESENPMGFPWAKTAFEETTKYRVSVQAFPQPDINKYSGIQVDGFGDFTTYLNSGMVDILEFEGDVYDPDTKSILVGYRIIVIDRKTVVHKEPFPSWLGRSSKEHVGWRLRPDNLMSMGPLDNLVGMQYRIDHLENLKADVFDQIAHPIVYERGYIEDWQWGPGERIKGDTESEIQPLRPDTTALNADFQISNMMATMEEMAGAPKQAMGIRTPGEKTAFEVQTLDNAAGRIFQNKIAWFETQFLGPILNQMLETARRNINVTDVASIMDEDYGVVEFLQITKDDLKGKGKLVPLGAQHFARRTQIAQNILGLVNSAAYMDEEVKAHISSIELAKLMEELLDLEKFNLVKPGVRIEERMNLQKKQTSAQELQISELAGSAGALQMEQEGIAEAESPVPTE